MHFDCLKMTIFESFNLQFVNLLWLSILIELICYYECSGIELQLKISTMCKRFLVFGSFAID